ncbi:MAG TPA: macro domain-containing protein [Ktedonobacterales bacterium]|nr:macro domain-containing protein [Ktedonobacterales bacterium]
MIQRALVSDLFNSNAQTLVNTVNCVGVMGKGVALEFKKRFPEMYEDYVARCAHHQVRLGEPYLYRRLFPPNILNFPTKGHWRSVSKLEDIVAGLEYLEAHYREWGITSLAVPPLGCGQGGLEWRVVGPTLFRYLSRLEIPVELYAPIGTPPEELETSFLGRYVSPSSGTDEENEHPRINPAWVALVEIVARIGREYFHWPIGRTRFQKLAYFATVSGLPTGLQFQRGSFGPFAPEVKSVLTKLVNNGLLIEEPVGKMLVLRTGPTYADAVQAVAYQQLLAEWESIIDRITDLLLRIPTRDTEIAATVHFAWKILAQETRRSAVPQERILGEVKRWKQRRNPPLRDEDIVLTSRSLDALGWIEIELDPAALEEFAREDELLLSV